MILGIETSCDETAVAISEKRRVLSNVIYSQAVHSKWGGVVPILAKKEHEKKLPSILQTVFKKLHRIKKARYEDLEAIAVTYGPGLAPALETGIRFAKEIARKYKKPLVPVNHLEGHLYSVFVQNSKGKPERDFNFPYLALIISGGHTELVLWKGHFQYKILGKTLDDAAGEALDKVGKMMGLGYPGGPVIERLAEKVQNKDFFGFPRAMVRHKDLNFSFSGLKTAFYYFIKKKGEDFIRENLEKLASSFQNAVFDSVLIKLKRAIVQTKVNNVIVVGGVSANMFLRKKVRQLVREFQGKVLFPPYKYLTGDNAGMIAVAGYFRFENGYYLLEREFDSLERVPRLSLEDKFQWKIKK